MSDKAIDRLMWFGIGCGVVAIVLTAVATTIRIVIALNGGA